MRVMDCNLGIVLSKYRRPLSLCRVRNKDGKERKIREDIFNRQNYLRRYYYIIINFICLFNYVTLRLIETMINEIKSECWYVFILWLIISCGLGETELYAHFARKDYEKNDKARPSERNRL